MFRFSSLLGIALLGMLFMLSACTRVVTVRTSADDLPSGSLIPTNKDDAWWSIAFRMNWDRDQSPEWYLDALLADQVCAPALTNVSPQIQLWRFHRRAGDDEVGHQLSLLIYTDQTTANALYGQIRDSSVLQWLASDDMIESVTITKVDRPELSPIAQTSDAAWPREIQASWPWFIMGVSQTWLSLIREVTTEQPLEGTSTVAILDYYRSVNDRVTSLWQNHGQHVYLHHLNALFGYQPLVIRETNLKRF